MDLAARTVRLTPAWPPGEGRMARLIRAHDWAATPLGPLDAWPERLKAAAELMLASPLVSSLAVGPERVLLYNDRAARLYGDRHPRALGRPLPETWPEAYATVAPLYARAFAGEAVAVAAQPLDVSQAGGEVFEVFLTPLRDEGGQVIAVHMTGFEVGARLRAEAALRDIEERQAFLLRLSDALRPLGDAAEVQGETARLLRERFEAGWCCYVEFDDAQTRITVARDAVREGLPSMTGQHDFSDMPEFLALWRKGQVVRVEDFQASPLLSPRAKDLYLAAGVASFLGVPVLKRGNLIAALILADTEPQTWSQLAVDLTTEGAERTWAAVERARAEASQRESEGRYRALFKAIDAGFCIIEMIFGEDGRATDYRFVETNPTFERQSGLAGAVGHRISEFAPDLEEHWFERYGRVALTGESMRVEGEVAPLGRWFDINAFRVGAPEQRRVAVLFTDISARRKIEAALRESEEQQAFLLRLSDALRAEPSAEAITNRALQMLFEQMQLDRCYVGIYRLAEDIGDFPHQVHHDRLPPLPAQVRLSAFPEALRVALDRTLVIDDVAGMESLSASDRASFSGLGLGALIAATLRKGENNPLWAVVAVSACPRAWTQGDIALVEEVAERTWAAAERARAEAALRESEARLRTLSEGIPQIVWRAVDHGLWTWASPQWTAFTGQAEEASRGWGWLDPLHPDDRQGAREAWERSRATGRFEAEYRVREAATGAFRWFQSRATPLRDAAGEVVEWLGATADVEDLRELQGRLQVVVAELQHRTRNLLAVVRSVADRTLAGSRSLEDFQGRFRDRMDALARVSGLLSRLQEDDRVAFDELLRTELAGHGITDADRLGSQVRLDGPSGVRLRSATVQTLALALHELATNALKHGALARPEGRLAVSWRLVDGDDGARRLSVDWTETGVRVTTGDGGDGDGAGDVPGSEPAGPRRRGYGRELIERALPYQLGAETSFELTPSGVRCAITLPVSSTMDAQPAPVPLPSPGP